MKKDDIMAILEENGIVRAWKIFSESDKSKFTADHHVIRDIIFRFATRGTLTIKQITHIQKLFVKIDSANKRKKKIEEEKMGAVPCPSGNVTIEGIILKISDRNNSYGVQRGGNYYQRDYPVKKMFVKSTEGYTVWGTIPSHLLLTRIGDTDRCVQAGDKVRFSAKVVVCKDDDKHGFFKRPKNAEVIL